MTDTITVLCDKWDVKVAGLETDLTDGGDGMDEGSVCNSVTFSITLQCIYSHCDIIVFCC